MSHCKHCNNEAAAMTERPNERGAEPCACGPGCQCGPDCQCRPGATCVPDCRCGG